MDEIGPKIKSARINLIILESDMGCNHKEHMNTIIKCMDYEAFAAFVEGAGFELVERFNDCDTTKTGQLRRRNCTRSAIDHHVWRRSQSAKATLRPL